MAMIDKMIKMKRHSYRLIKGILIGKRAGLTLVQIHAVRKCYSENTLDEDDIARVFHISESTVCGILGIED